MTCWQRFVPTNWNPPEQGSKTFQATILMLRRFYEDFILPHSLVVSLLLLAVFLFLGYEARQLEVDASAETLLLEDDEDLRLTRTINKRFESPDFLVIAIMPTGDLLSDKNLDLLQRIKDDLSKLERVESVISLLDVPLLESPPRPLQELLQDVPTLQSPGIDKELAKKEFLNSPIYRNLLVSTDFRTTALQVNLQKDEVFQALVDRRYELRQKEKDGTLTTGETEELARLLVDFKQHRDRMRIKQQQLVQDVRAVMDEYRDEAKLFLGGISMIVDDLITYVKKDLQVFGLGILVFLIMTLWVIFRQFRWILLPILCCGFAMLATSGFLGMFAWEVTVVSSNFISLQLIITMAITIHLIVRYRELLQKHPDANQRQLVLKTVLFMSKPCLYTALTTIAGFASLVLSGILPVIHFGWMMSAGTAISLVVCFLIFPMVVIHLPKLPPNVAFESNFALTRKLARFTERNGRAISGVSLVLILFSLSGAARLEVENSFIDYFKESTEIYQGMKVIDQHLGGTTPLDVVLDFDEAGSAVSHLNSESPDEGVALPSREEEEDDDFDEFEEEFAEAGDEAQYWFSADKMEQVEKLHDYLDQLPETGKVLSLGTLLKIGRTLNEGESLDDFTLALIYNQLPEQFREIILTPFVSVEHNQARFSVRIRDSEPDLRRNELLQRIRHELIHQVGLQEEKVQLANLLVLYNNMLQSLFDSQILTLGAVVAVLMLMFLLLFRSLKIACIAIFPNILSVGVVLGFMGWAGIPLDLMTITIAAISVGIAVDNTIHYIYRFRSEFSKDHNYLATMHRCHGSIGYAMYYTSFTIIVGFSILVFSNFIPTLYFGLLTGLAMFIALIAALTLLPHLLMRLEPFGEAAPLP